MSKGKTGRKSRPGRPLRQRAVRGRGRLLFALTIAAIGTAAAVILWLGGGAGGSLAVLRTADYHALTFSPQDANIAYFGHHNGVMRTTDGGRTWHPLAAQRNFDAMALAVTPDAGQIFLAGHNIFQVSRDGGATWAPVAHDLPGTDIHGFAMSRSAPQRLYAFVVGHGLFTSANGGRSWKMLTDRLPGDVMGVAATPTPSVLYAASMRAGVLKSTDGGRTWALVTNNLPSPAVLVLAGDPGSGDVVYAGTAGGLFKTTDGGTAWRRLPFPRSNVVALAVSPARPNVLLAVSVKKDGGHIHRSETSGETW